MLGKTTMSSRGTSSIVLNSSLLVAVSILISTTKSIPVFPRRDSCRSTKPAYDPLVPRATPLAARNDTPKVGARVRSLRRERGLTIEQLAAATGLTKGFISQLERDRTAPSLSSIARICDALGVRLSHIFEREPAPALVRRNERSSVDTYFPTENHLLSSRDEERFQAIESVVAPGAGAGDELYSLPGEMEFVYVLARDDRAAGRRRDARARGG